jgi:hypothetical protein
MTIQEYSAYYTDFLVTTLGPAVKREADSDIGLKNDQARQVDLENKKNGLIVLLLVAFIESNFLKKPVLTELRQFKAPKTGIPNSVDPLHLSCFVYLRDCFAHDPQAVLLPGGQNTTDIKNAVSKGLFPWVTISGSSIKVGSEGILALHHIVLRFFGETV